MIRRPVVVVMAAVVVALAVSTPVTLAVYGASGAAATTFSTGTLQPPTAVSGTGGTTAALTWTASSSGAATGYLLLRSATSGSGYAQVGTVTPVSATSTTDAPGAGTWYYVLDTYLNSWTSAHSTQASVVVSTKQTTATVGCSTAMQAAETSGSGDNNGYQLNPGNACASGGGSATDASSGTNTVNSCSDPGKDRHRFWGYAFGLPGTVSAVNGITLTMIAGENNTSGSTSICVQLSWDGGTTWTAVKQVSLTATALTTYTLGSSADAWGHTWTAAQLASPTFRVRVTDVSTTSTKNFLLDFLGASVTYTP